MFPVPTYFGQMGLGLPTETPEQQLARLSGNQSMGGGGTRKGLKFLLDDPNSNVSPTANAGTQLSTPERAKVDTGAPALLPTTNINGMATDYGGYNKFPGVNRGNIDLGNDRTPYSKFSMPSSSASAPPETSAPTAPSRGSIDVNQSAPSQPQAQNQPSYSPMVQQILDYQKQLAALPDPTAVAKAQTAKRGLGTKILDTLGGVLAGVQQGGIIGGLSGGIGGARGTLRRQAIEAKQQAENDRARANILQQYGITQAAAKQMDDEAKNQVAAQTAKQTGEKNAWEQKHQQMLYDLEVQKAKVEALYKDGQLTNQQRTDSLKELENATTEIGRAHV